jgi:septum formation protein
MIFSTKDIQVVLASSSKVRIEYLKKAKIIFGVKKHSVNEEKVKKKIKAPVELSKELAMLKAKSVIPTTPQQIIIGSDQVLVCQNKVISKPRTLIEAEKNLKFLRKRKHTLISSIVAIRMNQTIHKKTCQAHLRFKDISDKQLKDYLAKNKETALSCVGSYKIEDNNKYGFIEILEGDYETIIGFPAKNLINQIKNEKNIRCRKSS